MLTVRVLRQQEAQHVYQGKPKPLPVGLSCMSLLHHHTVSEVQVPIKFSRLWMWSQMHNLEQHLIYMLCFVSDSEVFFSLQMAAGSS